MKELERKALLGDKQAQQECTEKEIVLPCPKCFKPVKVRGPEDWKPTFYDPDSGGDPYEFDCECGLAFSTYKYDFKEALSDWNTRPAPPIGRCRECAQKEKAIVNSKGFLICPISGMEIYDEDYCSYFKPKEDDKNGM